MSAASFGMLALLGTLTAGCAGNPAAPTSPGTTTTGSGVTLTVPAVPKPLDATAFRDAPCRLIPEQQARELGRPVAQEERTGSRVACTWRADRHDASPIEGLSIRVADDGLDSIVRQCRIRAGCETWAVATINGYPVIRANDQHESKYGTCRLFVGIADNSEFMVTDSDLEAIRKGTTEGDAGGPRCDRADRAATIVIQMLKEGR